VSDAPKEIRFPVEIEVLMEAARVSDATPTGGGRTINNRLYFEYISREDDDSRARFEVRCYYSDDDGDAAHKWSRPPNSRTRHERPPLSISQERVSRLVHLSISTQNSFVILCRGCTEFVEEPYRGFK
jgi:hypothetical protein